MSELSLSIAHGLADVPASDWNAVANPVGLPYDPFLSWEFLEALERSGAAQPETGWSPHHILAHADNALVGAMPLYLKTHSQGEYIFDHSWADAYERAGGRYYPKLLNAVPFTPVTGRRRLVAPGPHADDIRTALLGAAVQIANDNDISSLHMNFLEASEYETLGRMGLLQRTDQQFHWRNNGYTSFDDFLAELSSQKRKNLRKERAKAQSDLTFKWLTGEELTAETWDYFFAFYMDTGSRKWGMPYLNRETFALLNERMADDILMILACDGDVPIAGALNMIGSETLYGRYWGRLEERPMLHFEVCYYQAIDFAIERGLNTVEAGAQGGHKLARGYVPTPTYSAHWIGHPGLRDAIDDYLARERLAVDQEIDYLTERTPFKKNS